MIYKIADNIVSPLGLTTVDNYLALKRGESAARLHTFDDSATEPFFGSLIDRTVIAKAIEAEGINADGLTFFEQICVLSVYLASVNCREILSSAETVFVLSTTKGNVELLGDCETANNLDCYLSVSARKIASYFGNVNTPIVASNACISGVCAQIAAYRAIVSGRYSAAVVIGGDTLSPFIVSGFQSFKALSSQACKPYDKDRVGLNLGEAAGTLILSNRKASDNWHIAGCSIHNDANHISGPSRTGEGAFRVLTDLLHHVRKEDLAFVNAHGTATPYNDEMESIAIHRAELDQVPLNGLKGYYGHTLGAAGVIETILSMQAVDDSTVLATKGYEKQGTTWPLNTSNQLRPTDKLAFIKILSGFGGSNAGIVWEKGGAK